MADWTRDTPWRQGSLVARDDLRAIGVSVEEQHVCGLVISHDCDLANDRLDHEPWVELVLLEPLGKLDPNLTYGKNPRRLHFQIGNASEDVECYEAHARTRLMLHKTDLAPLSRCRAGLPMPSTWIYCVVGWLADIAGRRCPMP
ncbi:hypothetical protein HML84_00920 [Alcanivorax sp. IO_7]|nr:hypothetical protein HML84_00920 [Alcanivorax sp. IO_7]